EVGLVATPAVELRRDVVGDREQPRNERRAAAELADRTPRLEEDLLGQVLRFRPIAHPVVHVPEHPLDVLVVKAGARVGRPPRRPSRQVPVRRRGPTDPTRAPPPLPRQYERRRSWWRVTGNFVARTAPAVDGRYCRRAAACQRAFPDFRRPPPRRVRRG